MRRATGLRAVEHAAAERDRRVAHLDEAARAPLHQGLDEHAAGRVTYLATPGRRSGACWYATSAGPVASPWSRREVRLLSHEEFVRWAGRHTTSRDLTHQPVSPSARPLRAARGRDDNPSAVPASGIDDQEGARPSC